MQLDLDNELESSPYNRRYLRVGGHASRNDIEVALEPLYGIMNAVGEAQSPTLLPMVCLAFICDVQYLFWLAGAVPTPLVRGQTIHMNLECLKESFIFLI